MKHTRIFSALVFLSATFLACSCATIPTPDGGGSQTTSTSSQTSSNSSSEGTSSEEGSDVSSSEDVSSQTSTTESGGDSESEQSSEQSSSEQVVQFTVSFDTDGGVPATIASQTVLDGHLASQPNDPNKDGYIFEGWYNQTSLWNFSTAIHNNVALVAHWALPQVYDVTLHVNGGTINSGNIASYTENVGATLPSDVTKANHTFDGWYDNALLSGEEVTAIAATETGDKEFWAKWTIDSYVVTFDKANGDETSNIHAEYNSLLDEPTEPVKAGYHFVGWFNGSDEWDFDNDHVTGEMTLTAHYDANSMTVTFAPGPYGEGDMDPQVITSGNNTPLNECLFITSYEGYEFDYWVGSDSNQYSNEQVINIVETDGDTLTLTAHFSYQLNFAARGLTGGARLHGISKASSDSIGSVEFDIGGAGNANYGGDGIYLRVKNNTGTDTPLTFKINSTNGVIIAPTTNVKHVYLDVNGNVVEGCAPRGWGNYLMVPHNFDGYIYLNYTEHMSKIVGDGEFDPEHIWRIYIDVNVFYDSYCDVIFGDMFTNERTIVDVSEISNDQYASYYIVQGAATPYLAMDRYYPSYDILYHLDGGSFEGAYPSVYYETLGLTLPTNVAKAGHTFQGWYDNAQCTGSPVTEIATTETGAKEYYALWSINNYSVTFNPANGDDNTIVNVPYNTLVDPIATPEKTGYTFDGWYKGLVEWDFDNDKVTTAVTLTAHYTPIKYTITLNPDNGDDPVVYQADYDSLLDTPDDPIKAGFTCTGWYNGLTKWNFATDVVKGDLTLVAHYSNASYAVTFDANGGDANPATQNIEYGGLVSTPVTPSYTGHVLEGWYKDSVKWNFANDEVTEAMTLVAHWNLASYTITFEPDNGSATSSSKADYNTLVTEPSAPSKSGYHFVGWYHGSELWDFANDKVTSDMTLTAHYDANSMTVSFVAGDGTGSMSSQTIYSGNNAQLKTSTFTPNQDSYVFDYWTDAKDNHYTANQVINLVASDGDTLTLTAHYKYAVLFNHDVTGGGRLHGIKTSGDEADIRSIEINVGGAGNADYSGTGIYLRVKNNTGNDTPLTLKLNSTNGVGIGPTTGVNHTYYDLSGKEVAGCTARGWGNYLMVPANFDGYIYLNYTTQMSKMFGDGEFDPSHIWRIYIDVNVHYDSYCDVVFGDIFTDEKIVLDTSSLNSSAFASTFLVQSGAVEYLEFNQNI